MAALRHRLSGEVARFNTAAEAMQLAAAQEQQARCLPAVIVCRCVHDMQWLQQSLLHCCNSQVCHPAAHMPAMLLQSLGEELEASRCKWQSDLSRATERLHAATAKVRVWLSNGRWQS